MNHRDAFRLPAIAGLMLLMTACVSTPREQLGPGVAVQDAASAGAAIDGFHQPRPGLHTGGQPAATAWEAIAAQGVTTIINLRPAAELAGRDEAAEVRAAGMAYREIPVAGPADITLANAARLWSALAQTPEAIVVHCSSGNRVGALLALGAATQGGLDTESAIAFGRAAGLGSAEARVREVLAAWATQ